MTIYDPLACTFLQCLLYIRFIVSVRVIALQLGELMQCSKEISSSHCLLHFRQFTHPHCDTGFTNSFRNLAVHSPCGVFFLRPFLLLPASHCVLFSRAECNYLKFLELFLFILFVLNVLQGELRPST